MMALWGKLKSGVILALAFLGILLGVWFGGRRSGSVKEQFERKKDELKAERETNQQHVETRQEVNDVRDTTNALPPGEADRRLRDGWMRESDTEKRD